MIKVVVFFCGCGGTSAGLQKSDMQILAGVDFDKDAGSTFKKNFPNSKFISKDIRELDMEELEKTIDPKRDFSLLFAACAPCQPFSDFNSAKSDTDRGLVLLDEFHDFVEHFLPEYLFIENVPGMQKVEDEKGPFFRFINFIRKLGYSPEVKVVESRRYGVPQIRKRLVMIASLHGKISIPEATHGDGKTNHKAVWDSIADLPPFDAGESHESILNHRSAGLREVNLKRLRVTPEGGGRQSWPDKLIIECHKSFSGHGDVYGRLSKNSQSAALSTKCTSISNGRFAHPEQDQGISVREAARLQTFDDNFIFEGSLQSMARQIGNAVPVELACVFGEKFKRHLISLNSEGGAK